MAHINTTYCKRLTWTAITLLASLFAFLCYHDIALHSSETKKSGDELSKGNIAAEIETELRLLNTKPSLFSKLNIAPLFLKNISKRTKPLLIDQRQSYFIILPRNDKEINQSVSSNHSMTKKSLISNKGRMSASKKPAQSNLSEASSPFAATISAKRTVSENLTFQKESLSSNNISLESYSSEKEHPTILSNRIAQAGIGNIIIIAQTKNNRGYASIKQAGMHNISITEQYSAAITQSNDAHVEQAGIENLAMQKQYQMGALDINDANLQQAGIFNMAFQYQNGFANSLKSQIIQHGNNNVAQTSQVGMFGKMESTIKQQGSNNHAFISQYSF